MDKQHPVVLLNFTEKYNELGDLKADVLVQLRTIARRSKITLLLQLTSGPMMLRFVINRLYENKKRKAV